MNWRKIFERVIDLRFEHVVHLVPHLGSGEVVAGEVGVLTHGPLHAVELGLVAGGVHEEAHAAGEVGRSVAGGAGQAGPPGHSTLQHRVGDHCDLEDNQNDDS